MAARPEQLAEIGPVALDGFEVWDKRVQAPAGRAERGSRSSPCGRAERSASTWRPARCWVGCDAVRVLYDPKRHRLGIVPGDPEAQDTYIIHYWDQIQIACRKLFEFSASIPPRRGAATTWSWWTGY
jgi:hypothetical protein